MWLSSAKNRPRFVIGAKDRMGRKKYNKPQTEAGTSKSSSKPRDESEKGDFESRKRNTREFSNSNFRRSGGNLRKEDDRKSEPFKRSRQDFEGENRRHTFNASHGRRSSVSYLNFGKKCEVSHLLLYPIFYCRMLHQGI
nr:PREDICTED: uncharacterized protein LOC107397535 [Tribolium castaneum]|eukprot:XP_015833544.1 PREDICTED: uncharacterized protein LOC107397535 [Tribolium castaneum]